MTELRHMPRQVWAFVPRLETSLARVKSVLDFKVSDRVSEQGDRALTVGRDVGLQSLLLGGHGFHQSPVLSL